MKLDGHSVIGQIRNGAAPRKWVFAEHKGKCFVRNQRWKLYDDGRFFDMEADPDEQQPLATDKLSAKGATAHRELQQALDGLHFAPPSGRQ